jgi:hypothetical protein
VVYLYRLPVSLLVTDGAVQIEMGGGQIILVTGKAGFTKLMTVRAAPIRIMGFKNKCRSG